MRGILKVIQGWVKLKGDTDGTLIGNTGDRLKVATQGVYDAVTGAQVVESFFFKALREGKVFEHAHTHTLSNGETYDHLFVTPDDGHEIYFTHAVKTQATGKVSIYEAPTVSANGTSSLARNKNRNSAATSTAIVYEAPTITATGLFLESETFGTYGGAKSGASQESQEYILKSNTVYLIRYHSDAALNDFSERFTWYEGDAP